MKVRFQADNDLRKAIVRGSVRREPLLDFRSAQAARLDGVSDPDVLALAADEGRILVTHDFQTMAKHFQQFVKLRRSSGVLLIGRICRSAAQWKACCSSGKVLRQMSG